MAFLDAQQHTQLAKILIWQFPPPLSPSRHRGCHRGRSHDPPEPIGGGGGLNRLSWEGKAAKIVISTCCMSFKRPFGCQTTPRQRPFPSRLWLQYTIAQTSTLTLAFTLPSLCWFPLSNCRLSAPRSIERFCYKSSVKGQAP